MLVLTGPRGAGKSTAGAILAERTGSRRLCPSDFPNRWRDLFEVLDHTEHAIVECVLLHSGLRRRIGERGASVFRLTAEPDTLRSRLAQRGESEETIRTWIEQYLAGPAYGTEIEPDFYVDTTDRTPAEVADLVWEFLWQGREQRR